MMRRSRDRIAEMFRLLGLFSLGIVWMEYSSTVFAAMERIVRER